jgi:predicted glutamine amidotransferase
MIAKVSSSPTSIIEETENCRHSLKWLSENGLRSSGPNPRGTHQDGCGVAFAQNGSLAVEKRGKEDFWNQSYHEVLKKARSRVFIVHDRDASSGLLTDENGAHPFTSTFNGQHVAFCHNGTIRNLVEEAQAKGTSDTLIFLNKILEGINELSENEVYRIVKELADTCDYSSMTAYLMTNNELFAWRVYDTKDAEKASKHESYYTQYLSLRNKSALLASEPLDDGNWGLLTNRTFLHLTPSGDGVAINYREL